MTTDAHSPLHQFQIEPLIPIHLGGLNLSFTNSSLWIMVAIACASVLFVLGLRRRAVVPGRMQGMMEVLVEFMQNTLRETAGDEAKRYFIPVFTLFLFVLLCNLLGMVPHSFTATSHVAVTITLSAGVFIAVTGLAIYKHGLLHFLGAFVPEGTPWPMVPLMFLLELISYLARPISLSLRLAINMTAGHILLKVFGALIVTFGLVGLFTAFPLLVVMIGFELMVAVLQAYIFTILTCVYLNQALHLH